jgi:uncharacterized protein
MTESEKDGNSKPRKPRGFAVLKLKDPDRFFDICQKGGKKAHAIGAAHEFTPEEAKAAGIIGGRNSVKKRKRILEAREADLRLKHEL